jgi:hypothetical protein
MRMTPWILRALLAVGLVVMFSDTGSRAGDPGPTVVKETGTCRPPLRCDQRPAGQVDTCMPPLRCDHPAPASGPSSSEPADRARASSPFAKKAGS